MIANFLCNIAAVHTAIANEQSDIFCILYICSSVHVYLHLHQIKAGTIYIIFNLI